MSISLWAFFISSLLLVTCCALGNYVVHVDHFSSPSFFSPPPLPLPSSFLLCSFCLLFALLHPVSPPLLFPLPSSSLFLRSRVWSPSASARPWPGDKGQPSSEWHTTYRTWGGGSCDGCHGNYSAVMCQLLQISINIYHLQCLLREFIAYRTKGVSSRRRRREGMQLT